MDTTPTQQDIDIKTRQKLATNIVTWGLGVVGVLGLAIIIIACFTNNGNPKEATQLVLTAILPLVGTWVGTVIAFYFAKENFEAATRASKDLLGIEEKLRSIPVTKMMILTEKIDAFKLGADVTLPTKTIKVSAKADDILLNDALDFLTAKNRNRRPIFDSNGQCVYVVHVSTLDKFRSRHLTDTADVTAQAKWTLNDIRVKDPDSFAGILAWACVAETASLADAKHAMDTTPNDCADVMVTKTGKSDNPVVGWLTNIEIGANSKA